MPVDLIASCWITAGPVVPHAQPLSTSPIDLRRRIAVAAGAGFRGFGLLHDDLVVARDTIGYPTLRSMLDDHGLVHVEVEMVGDWFTTDGRRPVADAVRRDLLTAAEALGARQIKAGGDDPTLDVPVERVAEELRVLAEQAAEVGTRIALEPMAFTYVRTPQDALTLVEAAAHPAAAICLDLWHVERAGVSLESIATMPAEVIAAVELDDGSSEEVGTPLEDTLHRRRLPGDGDFDTAGFVAAVRATGYDGPWGVEILSDEHRAQEIEQSVPKVYAAAMRYLGDG